MTLSMMTLGEDGGDDGYVDDDDDILPPPLSPRPLPPPSFFSLVPVPRLPHDMLLGLRGCDDDGYDDSCAYEINDRDDTTIRVTMIKS